LFIGLTLGYAQIELTRGERMYNDVLTVASLRKFLSSPDNLQIAGRERRASEMLVNVSFSQLSLSGRRAGSAIAP